MMAHLEVEQIHPPVGVDCPGCGSPLIWRNSEATCSVYGRRHGFHAMHALDHTSRALWEVV